MRKLLRASLAASVGFMALSGPLALPVSAQERAAQPTAPAAASIARPFPDAPYWNAALPVEQRVADLLARMTLEEKVAQIITVWDSKGD
ncbi:MAG: hypothetical protein KKG32_02815, partial [Alphaproteobacteria bacterium]|nr:hypothetical protein [Alphaproteobacteria bacterium]